MEVPGDWGQVPATSLARGSACPMGGIRKSVEQGWPCTGLWVALGREHQRLGDSLARQVRSC